MCEIGCIITLCARKPPTGTILMLCLPHCNCWEPFLYSGEMGYVCITCIKGSRKVPHFQVAFVSIISEGVSFTSLHLLLMLCLII